MMIDFIKSWVLNIVTLVMLIVLLELIVPSGKTKKFVNLVSGFILIIAIISPVLGVFKNGVDLRQLQINNKMAIEKTELQASNSIYSDKQMQQITQSYKRKLIKDIESSVSNIGGVGSVKGDVIIEENSKSSEFGKIQRIVLTVDEQAEKEIVKSVAAVGKINLSTISSMEKVESGTKTHLSAKLSEDIKKTLTKTFDVKDDVIAISSGEGRGD